MEKIRPCPQIEENEIYVKFCDSSSCSDDSVNSVKSVVENEEEDIISCIEDEVAYACENLEYEDPPLTSSESFITQIPNGENSRNNLQIETVSSLYRSSQELVATYMRSNEFLNAAVLILTISIFAFYSINKFIH